MVRVSGSLTVAFYCHCVIGVRWHMCPGAAFPPWMLSLGGAGTVSPHLVPGWEETLCPVSDDRSEGLRVVGWFGYNVAVSGPGPRPVLGALSPASLLSPGRLGLRSTLAGWTLPQLSRPTALLRAGTRCRSHSAAASHHLTADPGFRRQDGAPRGADRVASAAGS